MNNVSAFEKKYFDYVDKLYAIANGTFPSSAADVLYNDTRLVFYQSAPEEKEELEGWLKSELRAFYSDEPIDVRFFSSAFSIEYKRSVFKFGFIEDVLKSREIRDLNLTTEIETIFLLMKAGLIDQSCLFALAPLLFYIPKTDKAIELVKLGLLIYFEHGDENKTIILNLLGAANYSEDVVSWVRENIKDEYIHDLLRSY